MKMEVTTRPIHCDRPMTKIGRESMGAPPVLSQKYRCAICGHIKKVKLEP